MNYFDRVKETSTTTGTGAFTLAGAQTGFRAFSAVLTSPSDTCYYCITLQAGSEWETGIGTYSAANTLTRTTVLASSNAGSAVNFSAGTKDVFMTVAAQFFNPVNISYSSTGAGSSTNAVIPYDDTIPQITEGTELLTAAITPKKADNIISVRFKINISAAAGVPITAALFQSGVNDALQAAVVITTDTDYFLELKGGTCLLAGSTSARTYSLRYGASSAVSVYVNSNNAGRKYGGVYLSTLDVTEISV